MKIAADTQISKKTVLELKRKGYEIVYRANTEPDEVWIEKALDLGANVFISPDIDVPLYLDKQEVSYKWIDVRQGLRSKNQVNYLIKLLGPPF